jgi:phage shock protein PspC (stress-responsive transcriptional regulator)
VLALAGTLAMISAVLYFVAALVTPKVEHLPD